MANLLGISALLLALTSFLFAFETYNRSKNLIKRLYSIPKVKQNGFGFNALPVTQRWLLRKVSHPNAPASVLNYRKTKTFAEKVSSTPWLFTLLHALIIPVSLISGFLVLIIMNDIVAIGLLELAFAIGFVVFMFSSGFFELNDYYNQVAMNPYYDESMTEIDFKYMIIVSLAFKARAKVFLVMSILFILLYAFYAPILTILLIIFAYVYTYIFMAILLPLINFTGAIGVFIMLTACIVTATLISRLSGKFWKVITRVPTNFDLEYLYQFDMNYSELN